MAVLDPGDEAIIPAPYWVSYPDMVRLADATPVIVDTTIETGYKLTPRQLAAAITPATRLLLINSPCNPTGAAYSRLEWQQLGEVLAARTRRRSAVTGHRSAAAVRWWLRVSRVPPLWPRESHIRRQQDSDLHAFDGRALAGRRPLRSD